MTVLIQFFKQSYFPYSYFFTKSQLRREQKDELTGSLRKGQEKKEGPCPYLPLQIDLSIQ